MKITRVETIPIRVPIKPDLVIRGGRGLFHSVSPFLLVRIHTDEGIVGIGEASCTARWSGEDQVSAAHFVNQYFAPLLMGETVDDVARLNTKFAAAVAGNYFTKSALEMALWDLVGKAHSKPVWKIAGSSGQGAARVNPDASYLAPRASLPTVRTKWSISGVDPAKAAEIAKWAVAQGFTKMKVKVGIEPNGDCDRVRAVRDAVGPGIKLGMDANGGWKATRVAIETINRIYDECHIYFAEQPLPPGDHDALAEVRRSVPVPIIADESVYTLSDAKMLARAEAADVFSIYVGKAGGIGPARDIAEFAHSVGIKCTIGSNLELGVGSAAMVHLALCAPGIDSETYPCDIIGPLFYTDGIVVDPLPISGGSAHANDRPGLGVELDDEKVEKYRVR
ncbi:MAG TPA: mandelate racemase/muconate lactonizing enzyme family protein [Lacipirellulaceae bacterium]|nr:mandelate racemase/muconate lactonizing enzyme family protein [Lacipirellulaceae bacterium]